MRFGLIIAKFAEMSSHLQAQFLSAQDVEVQMMHRLTGILAAVTNHTIAVRQLFRGGDGGDDLISSPNVPFS